MHTDPSNRDRFCFPMNLHRQLGNVVGGENRTREVFIYFIYKTGQETSNRLNRLFELHLRVNKPNYFCKGCFNLLCFKVV